ncbi:hypothetical protein [Acidisphaera sp. S103]|uniref:hypothetical protein n=1 Tax=Acidisphaera sp. S103 TaxID=1747223 RepID=UPI00131B77A3|nr:hypothetical protein [Acidisphaera sp. S103]
MKRPYPSLHQTKLQILKMPRPERDVPAAASFLETVTAQLAAKHGIHQTMVGE